MSSDTIEKGYVFIKKGKIADFGKMTSFPKGLKEVEQKDLEGAIVVPGYVDAHSHLGMSEDGVGDEGEDINEMSDPSTPYIRSIDAIDPMDNCFSDAVKAGVTSVIVSPGSSNPIAGQIAAIKTYGKSIEEMIIKEPLAMKFSMGENPKRIYGTQDQTPMSRMATAAIIREALMKAQRYLEEIDMAEGDSASMPEFDIRCESLVPVLKGEMQAHFHAHRSYDIQTAIRIAEEFNLNYVIIHGTEGYRIADYLKSKKARVVCGPLMGTRSKPELSRQILDNCGILLENDIITAISSDHPEVAVEYLPLSASLLTDVNISREQALLALTYYPAKILGLESQIGNIVVGADADLLVYREEPLFNRAKPEMVLINGQVII